MDSLRAAKQFMIPRKTHVIAEPHRSTMHEAGNQAIVVSMRGKVGVALESPPLFTRVDVSWAPAFPLAADPN
jgi:hypothetical protein